MIESETYNKYFNNLIKGEQEGTEKWTTLLI